MQKRDRQVWRALCPPHWPPSLLSLTPSWFPPRLEGLLLPFPLGPPAPSNLQRQGFQGQAEPFQKLCLRHFQSSCSPMSGRRRGHAPHFVREETERANGSPKAATST